MARAEAGSPPRVAADVADHRLDRVGGEAVLVEDRGDDVGCRRGAEPAVQPVAGAPVGAVAPEVGADRGRPERDGRPRSRRKCDRHRPCRPARRRRVHQSRCASRKRRCTRSSRTPVENQGSANSEDFGSGKTFGWFAPLSTAGQPISVNQTGFDLATQAVGAGQFPAADAIVMGVGPPAFDVLEAEDPRLAGEPVGDRRAPARAAIAFARIVPVEALAGGDHRLQAGGIARRLETVRIAAGEIAVAPVGERHVVVDADGIDGGRGPERIEIEVDVARPVVRVIAEIFAPVRTVGDGGAAAPGPPSPRRPGRRARATKGKAFALVAQLRQSAQLRADDEAVHPAGGRREMGIVQHHAPVAEIAAPIGDAVAADIEVRRRCGAAERLGPGRAPRPSGRRCRARPGAGSQVMRPRHG